jgi:magnesium chelatase family protein
MLSKVYSAQVTGVRAEIIDVEVDITNGLHSFSIVGLPDKAVEEAKDRISAAIKNSGFRPPQKGNKKVIVSLAPADIKKEGTAFDLAIALGHLIASKEIKFNTSKKLFLGELALSGDLRPIKGALILTKKAKESGFTDIFLPAQNVAEAALINGVNIYGVMNLKQLVSYLAPELNLETGVSETSDSVLTPAPPTQITHQEPDYFTDFAEVKGQPIAKRGLEIAAAGRHNVAMYGPPGTGKTMLARAFTGILPDLSFDEVIEATGIHSAAGVLINNLITKPPFRSPHHTSSYVSLVGGGAWPKPGEITLAHHGVLFLDEFPEFDRQVIEALRQPLEDKVISIARARGSMIFPASFILIAAMNLCPCGNRGLREKECVCSQAALVRYSRKISGPITDRIDIWLNVPQIDPKKLSDHSYQETTSKIIRDRVEAARERQAARFAKYNLNIKTNSEMGVKELRVCAPLSDSCINLLNDSAKRLDLSARAYHRVIKLARTIADLDNQENIKEEHLLEALQYRPKQIL